ncbi:MAG: radical SAM protein [Candidatus Omnitrophota bacterium]|nr:radical SAM protein [Candidatus Omnitrophota bacterium]
MKYNHVLCLYPYLESSNSTMGFFPPTGLEYIAASLEGLVDKLTLIDLRQEEEFNDLVKLNEFISQEIDLVCISITWDNQFNEVCNLINKLNKDVPLIVGGQKATEDWEGVFSLCPEVDIIVRGEGEKTIQEIVKEKPKEEILGISYRRNGEIVHNPNRPLFPVEDIPFPNRRLRRSQYRFSLNGRKITATSFDTVLSARGCPFQCKFCTFTINPLGQKRDYSARSPKSVIEELKNISADIILFSDDNFFTDIKRSEEICDLIIEHKINKRFIAQTRLEIAKYPHILEKAVGAGFKVLLTGIESPHNRILEQLNKGFTQEEIRSSFKVIKKYDMIIHGYFIFGNITETEEEMLYISEFAKEIQLDAITLNKLRIEKYSPLRKLAQETLGYHITDSGALFSDTYSHADLKKIGKKLRFSFYTPQRFMKLFIKCIRIKLFTKKEIVLLLISLPTVIYALLKRDIKKKRLKETLWRLFSIKLKKTLS